MKRKQPNILILTGDFGDGHKQAAYALQEAANHQPGKHGLVNVVDMMELMSPKLHTISKQLFLRSLRSFPSLYRYVYEKTKKPGSSWTHVLHSVRLFSTKKLCRLIDTLRPDIVVSTFPIAAAAMSHLKSKKLCLLPTVTVITDHTNHGYWLHPHTDHYIVATEEVKSSLQKHGVDTSKVTADGIPIRIDFTLHYDKQLLCGKHGLNPELPTVMWMGGGYGFMGEDVPLILDHLSERKKVQVIVVCGRNERLLRHCLNRYGHLKHMVVTGFIEHVHELMAVSDFIITKSGGLTTAEALSQSLPMLLYRPLPGQEEDNARYLVNSGAAWLAEDKLQLQEQIQLLLDYPELLSSMKKRIKELQNHQSAHKALHTIHNIYYSHSSGHFVQEQEFAASLNRYKESSL